MTIPHPADETIIPEGLDANAILLQIPVTHWPADLANSNQTARYARGQWRRTKAWRRTAAWLAMSADLPTPIAPPVRADVWFRFAQNRRRDVSNYQPTCKAIVDGLRDAGVLLEDNDEVFDGPYPHRYKINNEIVYGPDHIVIALTQVGDR